MNKIDAFPLTWPSGHPRNTDRSEGAYRVTTDDAVHDLEHELELLGAQDIIISSNVPLRKDGRLYANHRTPDDPGVAVYWRRPALDFAPARDFVIPCDAYTTVRANVRAIGLAIYHLRRLELSAGKVLADRAFEGFARLPASAGADGRRPWRDVFGWTAHALAKRNAIDGRFRELARDRHPDRGGSHADMTELNRAYEEALREAG